MKKFLIILFLISGTTLFAQEKVLFDYTAKANVLDTGYDWVENAKTIVYSGMYIPGKNISNPVLSDEYGLAIRTDIAPRGDSNFAIRFITPIFNTVEGTGIITNAGAVKSMDIVLTLNRGYDEVSVIWEQAGKEYTKKFSVRDTTETVTSMYEFTAHIDFENYIEDVRNRNTKKIPIAGLDKTSILLKEIKITTHAPSSDWEYSPTCIVGIKRITVVCDKAIDDATFEKGKEADNIFNVKRNTELQEKLKADLTSDIQRNQYTSGLMVKEEQTSVNDVK